MPRTLDFFDGQSSASAPSLQELTVQTKTANYTVLESDDVILASGSGTTITLPDPSSNSITRRFTVINVDASNDITIDTTAGDIDGGSSIILSGQYTGQTFVTDGTDYFSESEEAPLTTVSVTGTYSIREDDDVVLCNGTFTVTLPAPNKGKDYRLINTGTGTITVATTSGNIDGNSTTSLVGQYSSVSLVNNGTNFFSVGGSSSSNSENEKYEIAASVGSSALTVELKNRDGNDPDATTPVDIWFRDTDLTAGEVVKRTVSASLSAVVDSGATLGTEDGNLSRVYVYAIDNSGTVELAVSLSLFPENTELSTTVLSSGSDSGTTIYSETARSNVAVKLLGFVDSTQTTAGTWASAPTLVYAGAPNFFEPPKVRSKIQLSTGNGHGSTANKIRRFSDVDTNTGPDLTLTQSSTLGDSITINTDGFYAISYTELANTGTTTPNEMGISLNATGGDSTTSIQSLSVAKIVILTDVSQTYGAYDTISTVRYFESGDILRAHTNGSANLGSTSITKLVVEKIGY